MGLKSGNIREFRDGVDEAQDCSMPVRQHGRDPSPSLISCAASCMVLELFKRLMKHPGQEHTRQDQPSESPFKHRGTLKIHRCCWHILA